MISLPLLKVQNTYQMLIKKSAEYISILTLLAYQRNSLLRFLKENLF